MRQKRSACPFFVGCNWEGVHAAGGRVDHHCQWVVVPAIILRVGIVVW